MKILLFGGSGQLGYEVHNRARDLNFEVVSPVISEVNISEEAQVKFLIKEVKPDIILNAAAYTAVDNAEKEKEEAFRINRDGVAHIGHAAKELGCRVIHVSTDYVFDGKGKVPIREEDATNPINVYGESKLAGERVLQEIYPEGSLTVRTSSLHGQRGINFVHTMLKLFAELPVVKVVDDQIMSPTWAGWLAEVLLDLGRLSTTGVIHASCSGAISWFDFAEEILKLTHAQSGSKAVLERIPSTDLKRPAPRPMYSVLDCSKLAGILGRSPIPWKVGLTEHLREIGYKVP